MPLVAEDNNSAKDVRRGHQWVKGQSGNPAGGPKGNTQITARRRARISGAFLADAHKEWERSGPKALARMAEEDPSGFVKVYAGLLPKDVNLNVGLGDQLAEFLQGMMDQPGDSAVVIEGKDINGLDDDGR